MGMQRMRDGILVVVSGFSGAGKGTIMKRLLEKYDGYALSVSATTRDPRPGEKDGRDYFFLNKETFEEKIDAGAFIEHANYCGNYYGTPRDYVEKNLNEGYDVLLEIEIQGALKIKEQYPTALLIFVMPPTAAELKKRLTGRGTETPDVVAKRLNRANEEAEGIENYDYILINDEIDACTDRLHALITSAHAAAFRNQAFIDQMRTELQDIVKGAN